MTGEFGLDYLLFAFGSAVGVLQIVFAYNRIEGMLFLRRSPRVSALLGAALVVSAFTWFFVDGPRDIPDTQGGLDGPTQAGVFAVGVTAAIVVTALLSSLVNHRWGRQAGNLPLGVGALRQTTYLRALVRTGAALWREVRSWIAR